MNFPCKSCGGEVTIEQDCKAIVVWEYFSIGWRPTEKVLSTDIIGPPESRCDKCGRYNEETGWVVIRLTNTTYLKKVE